MISPQPYYTHSRLIIVDALANPRRTYLPAGHEPRKLVGVRIYGLSELTRNPENSDQGLSASTALARLSFNFVEWETMDVYLRKIPGGRLNAAYVRTKSPRGFPPVVFPLAPTLCDVGGSWVRNPTGGLVRFGFEFFWDAR